jgi:hypothetical protein
MASVMSKFRPAGLCHKTFTAIIKYLIDIKLGQKRHIQNDRDDNVILFCPDYL